MALWILILGAVVPPVVTMVLVETKPRRLGEPADSGGMALLFTFIWFGMSFVQVFGMTVAAWALQWMARSVAKDAQGPQ